MAMMAFLNSNIMKVIISSRLNFNFIPFTDRKKIEERIEQLKECGMLGEVRYGRPHCLKGNRNGMIGLRIGKTSRLLLSPIEFDDERRTKENKPWYHYITGVIVHYSPNHYNTYY